MSYPYIIWTMQRTGGTTLATLLATLSEYQGVQHEPFNHDRRYGWVTQAWDETHDPEQLRQNLNEVLATRPVIKHCHELMPTPLNLALMEVSTALGYRHMVLDRRDETGRILSLELARLTGAWGGEEATDILDGIARGEQVVPPMDVKGALHHMRACRRRREELDQMLIQQGQHPHVITFEDVYSDPIAGRARVAEILDFIEIDPAEHPTYDAMLDEALRTKGQNSARIMDAVPNIREMRRALGRG